MSKHTPGPWTLTKSFRGDHYGNRAPCYCIDGAPVCPEDFDEDDDYLEDYSTRICELFTPFVSEDFSKADAKKAESEMLANAHLIAAAPDLLRVCKAIQARLHGRYDDPDLMAMGPLNAVMTRDLDSWLLLAIARAEGGAA